MSIPVDPTLDCSAAVYFLENSKVQAPAEALAQPNMYAPATPGQEQQQQVMENPEPPKGRLERFRDYLGRTCCSCFLKLPVVVIIVSICIILALLLALIPTIVILSNSERSQSRQTDGLEAGVIRSNHFFPKPDPIEIDEDDMDKLRGSNIRLVHGIPSTALFPPNVSLCDGFGFACTNEPSVVISTALRCDGKSDCPDGSDELNCKRCQSAFSCSISPKTKVRVCLRAEQMCDGVTHCPDGYDEEKHCKTTCDEGEMSCPSTALCLPPSSVCDGVVDCDTEDDEVNCEECNRGAKFCEVTKRCIPAGQLCDGIAQCPDRSDEQGCNCRSCCGSDKALCASGECIERSKVCDGIMDCGDGMDEKDCPGTCLLEEGAKIPVVQCADGRTYPEAEACSGAIEQCAYNCTKCDPRLAFTCKDKKCVPQMLVCDGIEDCSEGEDERSCTCAGLDKFECRSASGKTKCIPKTKVCDGVWDCMDGKDEMQCKACPHDTIRCHQEGKCIPKISRCDGIADCKDGSDEAGCTCRECIGQHWNTYMCGSGSHCFRRDEVCAPYTICPNATKADKVYCAGRALRGVDWLK